MKNNFDNLMNIVNCYIKGFEHRNEKPKTLVIDIETYKDLFVPKVIDPDTGKIIEHFPNKLVLEKYTLQIQPVTSKNPIVEVK